MANPTVSEDELAGLSRDALLVLVPRAKTIHSLEREIASLQTPTQDDQNADLVIELLQAERDVELARQERAKAILVRGAGARIKLVTFDKAVTDAHKQLEQVRAAQAEQRLLP